MKQYVGAKKVGCDKCIFCNQCLVEKEILYSTESQIHIEEALWDDLRCSSCGCRLASWGEDNVKDTQANC